MEVAAIGVPKRRPRFRRAAEPPPFRLTADDVEIVRVVAKHRLIRSTHIAALVGRSLDRTNDRLLRLFHSGYVDRPRAQLDYYPTFGSAPMIYALADRGVRLLRQCDGTQFRNAEWSRKNREAGRPFIEHQIEIVNFEVELQRAVRQSDDIRLVSADELIAEAPHELPTQHPFSLHARLTDHGILHEAGVIPDSAFALGSRGAMRRNFLVEIDRGTMPVTRSDPEQTSFERKMRVYLAAHAAKQHERQFGWRNFRVLVVTTDRQRIRTMRDALSRTRMPRSAGPALFLFAAFDELRTASPLTHRWTDGSGRAIALLW